MIDFSTLQGLSIPEGVVTQITDASGGVLWKVVASADEPTVILEVTKQTDNSYAGETQHTDNEFVLFDIYPKTNGTVSVTYGGLTKTITDTSGVEAPNAQQVFFGKFNGESDSVATPTSGTLTIEGAYRGYGLGSFGGASGKSSGTYAPCVIDVHSIGNPVYIGDRTFYNCTNLALTELPSGLTYIGARAFYGCTSLAITSLPSGLTRINDYTFYDCRKINIREIPEGVTYIGSNAFYMCAVADLVMRYGSMTLPSTIESIGASAFQHVKNVTTGSTDKGYLGEVRMLATVPPTLGGENVFGDWTQLKYSDGSDGKIVVPPGCGAVYKATDGWSKYTNIIVEAS